MITNERSMQKFAPDLTEIRADLRSAFLGGMCSLDAATTNRPYRRCARLFPGRGSVSQTRLSHSETQSSSHQN
jgi:hypothetical protein